MYNRLDYKRLFQIFFTALAAVLLTIFLLSGKCSAQLTVKMLDVGQGDSFLIQTDTENILIDTADVGARNRLNYYLQLSDVETIDKLILTHPHADHIGNAAYLMSQNRVRYVYDNGRASSSQYYRAYVSQSRERHIPRYTLREGDIFFLDDGAYLEILSANRFDKYENDNCIVAKLVYGNFSMLFTGDAEISVEDSLFQNSNNLSATILKAGHHGSKTSSTLDFVQAVSPQYVFISAKLNNKFGHPHAAALDNFLLAGVPKQNIFWTGKNGAVTVITDGTNITVTPEISSNWLDEYLNYKIEIEDIWIDDSE